MYVEDQKGILWAVVLDKTSLLERVGTIYEQEQGHHVTLQNGCRFADVVHLLNQKFFVRTLFNSWNGKIQAVSVELPPEIADICWGSIPHITVSKTETATAANSNELLKTPRIKVKQIIMVEVRTEFYPLTR